MFEKWQYDQRRGIFSPGEAGLTQEYWMYFKENRQSMAGKGPPIGRIDMFQTGTNAQNGNRFIKTTKWAAAHNEELPNKLEVIKPF